MTYSSISRFTSSGPMMILLSGKLTWCKNHDWTAVTTLRLTFQHVSQSVIQSCFFPAQLRQPAHFTNSEDGWWLSVDHYQTFANYQSNLSTNSETFQLWDSLIFLHSLTPSGAIHLLPAFLLSVFFFPQTVEVSSAQYFHNLCLIWCSLMDRVTH